jgi:hypothetical protein
MGFHRWRRMFGLAAAVAVLLGFQAGGTDYYVAPDGDDEAVGSAQSPWQTLSFALSKSPARAGDRVLVTPGTYTGTFECTRSGEPGKPLRIVSSEWAKATIEGTLNLFGAHVWVEGLDIRSFADQKANDVALVNLVRPGGKVINCVLHDRLATGVVILADDCEVYGCLIADNGVMPPYGNKGLGIRAGIGARARIERNIIFDQVRSPIMVNIGAGDGIAIVENICFASRTGALIGISENHPSVAIQGNVLFADWKDANDSGICVAGKGSGSASIENNTILCSSRNPEVLGKRRALGIEAGKDLPSCPRVVNNRVYGFPTNLCVAENTAPVATLYADGNRYGPPDGKRFRLQKQDMDLDGWKRAAGKDITSRDDWSPTNEAFVFANKYDPTRLHPAIYIVDGAQVAPIKLAGVRGGTPVRAVNVRDLGKPVFEGSYNSDVGLLLPPESASYYEFNAYLVFLGN